MSGADLMERVVGLEADDYAAAIVPAAGGSLAWLRFAGRDLLRPASDAAIAARDPVGMAMFPMVPFANRIRNGRFEWQGREYRIRPNNPPEPHAIHGHGWKTAWTIAAQRRDRVALALELDEDPYCYSARQVYQLDERGLEVTLEVTNRASRPMPFGLGFHPWFRRTPATELRFYARRFWLEAPGGFPSSPVSLTPELDFSRPMPLPTGWRNNAYEMWGGEAEILYPEEGFQVEMLSCGGMRYLMLYADPALPTFCVEPQTHLPAAFNRPAIDNHHGLIELAEGKSLSRRILLRHARLAL